MVEVNTGEEKKNETEDINGSKITSTPVEKTGGDESYHLDDGLSNVDIPFLPEWTFGTGKQVRVENLSIKDRELIAYPIAHSVVLYDYENNKQNVLLAHRKEVSAIGLDGEGMWIVSVDKGDATNRSAVIVWNVKSGCAEKCLKTHLPELGHTACAMSHDGRFVVTISTGPIKIVQFWTWKEQEGSYPAAVLELPNELGAAHTIEFSPTTPEFFMVTCDANVAFLGWKDGNLHHHFAELLTTSAGRLVHSIFQRTTTNAVSISAKGFVVVWEDPPVYVPNCKVSRRVIGVDKHALTDIAEVDRLLVIGTSRGNIRFYNQQICILFWFELFKNDGIRGLSFRLDAENTSLAWVADKSTHVNSTPSFEGQHLSREILEVKNLPRGPRLDNDFLARDFIVHTTRGRIVLVSLTKGKCVVLQNDQAVVTVIALHPTKPQLIIGRVDGSVTLHDYNQKEMLANLSFKKDETHKIGVTSVKYHPSGLVVVCGLSDCSLHLLDPDSLQPVPHRPLRKARGVVQNLCFSEDGKHMAHSDSLRFVTAYTCADFSTNRWSFMGKRQIHTQSIVYLNFASEIWGSVLQSLGEDRLLIEYDVSRSAVERLLTTRIDRVEHTATPLYLSSTPSNGGQAQSYLLIPTSEFKFRMLDPETRQICRTAQGPMLTWPVTITKVIGNNPYVTVCVTKRRMGLQLLPPDGNPLRNTVIIGHPVKISNILLSPDNKYVFSIGANDQGVFMWKINTEVIQQLDQTTKAIEGLDPWLLSLDGGKDSWLFKEMQRAFCWAQVINQGIYNESPKKIISKVPLEEIPDLMRALGYFPSNFQISNVMREASNRFGKSVSFQEFVKLFINYKPPFGLPLEHLKEVFELFGFFVNDEYAMTKKTFLSVLLEKGEPMTVAELESILQVLLGRKEAKKDARQHDFNIGTEDPFHFLPDTITFSYLVKLVYGIVVK